LKTIGGFVPKAVAGSVAGAGVVGVAGAAINKSAYAQLFSRPQAGSPKTALVQATPLLWVAVT
jgi:hypothetical protein